MPGFYHTIARYYEAENQDKNDDIELYLQMAEQYGDPILEIGCGTGRVVFPLAQGGYTVHGIDNEGMMLKRAEQIRQGNLILEANTVFHRGDVLTHQLEMRYRLILVPYNGLMHFLDQAKQIKALEQLRSWIRDDGTLVLDLPNAGQVFATRETDAILLERTFLEPETGHMVMQQSHSYLNRTAQLLRVTWIYDEIDDEGQVQRTVAPMMLYYFFFSELRLLLERASFAVQTVYGDVDYSPFEDGSERMIVVAKPV